MGSVIDPPGDGDGGEEWGRKKGIQERPTGIFIIGCVKGVVMLAVKKNRKLLSSLLAGGRWIMEGRSVVVRIFVVAVDGWRSESVDWLPLKVYHCSESVGC